VALKEEKPTKLIFQIWLSISTYGYGAPALQSCAQRVLVGRVSVTRVDAKSIANFGEK